MGVARWWSGKRPRPALNLALQGGGAHGAFTWGVLDALLEADRFDLRLISGTSAGAVNAVALLDGWLSHPDDPPAGARARLGAVWDAVCAAGERAGNASSMADWIDAFSHTLMQVAGPSTLNPLALNPLRDLLIEQINFERIIAAAHGYERATTRVPPQIRLAATDLLAGKARIFAGKDICLEAVLASACLPTLHHTVTIDGRRYWDGGFTVNPELLGLIVHRAAAPDTLLIELSNPRQRADLGHESARLIAEETARLTFTQPLQRELAEISRHRAVHAGLSVLGRLSLAPDTTARLCARHRLHGIDAAAHTRALEPGSKLRPTTENIARLFDAGRFEAISWLENHGSGVGVRETFNWPSQTPDEGAP